MQRSLRLKTIISAVNTQGRVSVEGLSELTGVSAITIRRDLTQLESQGLIARAHGAAVRASQRGTPMPFAVRAEAHHGTKVQLAGAVAALIQDHEALIIDNGTTCLAVAQELAGRPLTVLPLSLHAAAAIAGRAGAEVVTPGGPIETDSLAYYGAAAVESVREFRADTYIMSSCSAHPAHGLTSTGKEDALLKQAALGQSGRAILVVTADKLERTSPFEIAPIDALTHLVTTRDAPTDILTEYRALGIEVTQV